MKDFKTTVSYESSVAPDQQSIWLRTAWPSCLKRQAGLGHESRSGQGVAATASHILQAEIERCSGANGSARGGLAAWQILRVRAYIDATCTVPFTSGSQCVARRSPAHFSRKFKRLLASRHSLCVRRRLEKPAI